MQPALGTKLHQLLLPSMFPAAWPLALPSPLTGVAPGTTRGVELSQVATKPTYMNLQRWHRERDPAHSRDRAVQQQDWGPGCPKAGLQGLGLTNKPDSHLSHSGLRVPEVRQALMQVLFSPALVLHQLERGQADGHVT